MQIARMRQWMADEQDHLFKHIIVLSFNLMMKLRVEAFGLEQLTAWSKRIQNQVRAQDYLQRVTSPPNDTSMKVAQENLRKHMKRLDQELEKSGGPWVCGETFTLADICLAPIFDRIEWLDLETIWEDLPKTTEWYDVFDFGLASSKVYTPLPTECGDPENLLRRIRLMTLTINLANFIFSVLM